MLSQSQVKAIVNRAVQFLGQRVGSAQHSVVLHDVRRGVEKIVYDSLGQGPGDPLSSGGNWQGIGEFTANQHRGKQKHPAVQGILQNRRPLAPEGVRNCLPRQNL